MRIEQYINLDYINNILEQNKGKKIILFGGGTAGTIIQNKILKKYSLSYIIDNNQELWGTTKNNLTINSPEILKKEMKGEFIVLIAGRFAIGMSKQLNSYGLEKDKDYYDIYLLFEFYFRLKKAIETKEQFLKFVASFPDNSFSMEEKDNNTRIAVVARARIVSQETFFDIGLFLLLKYMGYNVTLIVDAQYNGDDFCIGHHATEEAKKIAKEIIDALLKRFPQLMVEWIDDDSSEKELTPEEIKEVERLSRINTTWQRSILNINTITTPDKELYNIFYDIMNQNMKHIKAFFIDHNFDVVTMQSGIQYQSGIYTYFGKEYGFRTPSYDGFNDLKNPLWSTDAPCGNQYDVSKVIIKNMLSSEEKRRLVQEGENVLEFRRNSKNDLLLGAYQIVDRKEEDWYDFDIIIPLNIMWDAAALGIERIFTSMENWVLETVEFIINNTDAKVAIREHPAENNPNENNDKKIAKAINKKYQNNKRVHIVKSDDPINSYSLLKYAKVVLPLSSTLGIESAILDKVVVTHSRCYYNSCSFVYSADSKEDYFNYILQGLNAKQHKLNKEQHEEACMALVLAKNCCVNSDFNEVDLKWLNLTMEELSNSKGVDIIVNAIVHEIPVCLQNIKDNY